MLVAYLQRCWFNWFGAQPRHWNFSKLPRWFKGAVKFKNYWEDLEGAGGEGGGRGDRDGEHM